jgi:hypothetical protein
VFQREGREKERRRERQIKGWGINVVEQREED